MSDERADIILTKKNEVSPKEDPRYDLQRWLTMIEGRLETVAREEITGSLRKGIRRYRWLSLLVIVAFFGGFGSWASLAPLATAVVGGGVVNPEGSIRPVQHLEGGIIREVYVSEGDRVEAGERLYTLEDIQARSEVTSLQKELTRAFITEARLLAEIEGEPTLDLSSVPKTYLNDPEVSGFLRVQESLLESRLSSQKSREDIIKQRIQQLLKEIEGLTAQIESQTRQIALIQEEIGDVRTLLEKGLIPKPRLLALERAETDLAGDRAANRSAVARAEQRIGETEFQLIGLREQNRDRINEELGAVRAQISNLRSTLDAGVDVLTRTTIAAPVNGTVLNVYYNTRASVVPPGGTLLDLVPQDVKLQVNARISPLDIEAIHEGMPARIVLSAYNRRNAPEFEATVSYISADRLENAQTGDPYYLVRVEVSETALSTMGEDIEIIAGMPVDVMILTGERTLMSYLLKPIVDSLRYSFTEQ